ncbi:hypothetical protein DPV78_009205 [Talaromyces pinophilus]|nr:hypothetical protein DPV78_009205 [Talaromyces pinophilus]
MASKFSAFNITDLVYKTVGDVPLKASILVPKNVNPGRHPVIVHFHGGGLIVGDKLFAPWFPLWIIQLAESEGAIIVSPDYRLIPEAKGAEILEDIRDFWNWLHGSLPNEILKTAPGISLGMEKVAVAGESAGGYLSLQSSLLFPKANISVVLAQYATLDIENPLYNDTRDTPHQGKSFVDEYMANLKPGAIRISSPFPDCWDLCEAILAEGRHREFIGDDDIVKLRKSVERATHPAPMFLANGADDTIMPLPVTEEFVKRMKEFHPNVPILLTVQPGSHGFDVSTPLTTDWVQNGVAFIKQYWP